MKLAKTIQKSSSKKLNGLDKIDEFQQFFLCFAGIDKIHSFLICFLFSLKIFIHAIKYKLFDQISLFRKIVQKIENFVKLF